MDAFAGLETELAQKLAIAFQGMLILFFFVSPLMGKLLHYGIAKFSSIVIVVCTMFIVGNLSYMSMVYGLYQIVPHEAFSSTAWIILSFLVAFSLSLLVGRYINWYLSDNIDAAVWTKEYDNLTEEDMMPFDRRRKREMERRKRSHHDT